MTTQQQFDEWFDDRFQNLNTDSVISCEFEKAKSNMRYGFNGAWQHQQARIDELENKLAIAVEAFTSIASLSGNPKGERKYDLIWEKANEALKQIEVSE